MTLATPVRLDPRLQQIVDRARVGARERGELLDEPSGMPANELSAAAKAAVAGWVATGDYERVVAEITADDPDLATQ